jgi:hypothetical protein
MMSTSEIKRKLFDYIRSAEARKVKALYTMVENEIKDDEIIWTDELVEELDKRIADFENGKAIGFTWDEVKSQAKKSVKVTKS